MASTYQLTAELVAAHSGASVVCLNETAVGRSFELLDSRPGPELNERITLAGIGAEYLRSDVEVIDPPDDEPSVVRVNIRGPLEQRAGYHGDSGCGGGWADGYDAIAERMEAALEAGDVVMVIDSPGGAVAGLDSAVKRIGKAKRRYKRAVYAYADEMIASAAYWLAATVADQVYLPMMGEVGSIGARSSHESVAGALEQAGVEVTHFGWPGDGKYAFARELPLSDVARKRAARDINACGKSFAKAITKARPAVTMDKIVKMDADTLTGAAAVMAGLVDGLASLDEVIAMAITNSEESKMARRLEDEKPADDDTDAEDEKEDMEDDSPKSPADAEDEEPDPDAQDDEDEPSEEAQEDEPDPDAEDEDDPDAQEDEDEPKARRGGKARTSRSLASLAGLQQGASTPAIISALAPLVGFARHVMAETNTRSAAAARGAFAAIMQDASAAGKLRTKLSAERRRNNARRRFALLKKLQAANTHSRGELFIDSIHPTTGKRVVKPARIWQEMKLATLESFVTKKLSSASPRRGPASPDPGALDQTGIHITARDREIAQKTGHDPARVAKSRQALFNNNNRGV